jgi:hypothetical protein
LFRVERIEEANSILLLRSVSRISHSSSGADIKYELIFNTDILPPLGAVAFRIVKEPDLTQLGLSSHMSPPLSIETSTFRKRRLRHGSQEMMEFGNGDISVAFDASTGMLMEISSDGVVLTMNQTWGYYTSFDSTVDSVNVSQSAQNSGAYIFRPSIADQKLISLTPKLNAAKFIPTSVGIDVHAFFEEPWLKQVIKLYNDSPYVEIEYTIGPIPIRDRRGKEIVTRLSAPINSSGEFFTDSNGREFQKRKRNFRPSWDLEVFEPVAGNYYPVNAAIYIEDLHAALSVMVDRSQGGSSLIDGSIELMVQRRTLADDARGVDEPLNETCDGMTPYPPYGFNQRIGDGVVITGKHRIRVGKGLVGASLARSEMDDLFAEPVVFVGSGPASDPVVFQNPTFSGLTEALPTNIMLVTFMRLLDSGENAFLVRLGHQYGTNEHALLSQPVDIDISKLFVGYIITSVLEMTLTGNQEWNDVQARRANWNGPLSTVSNSSLITIAPMEIRTFQIVMSIST